MARNGFGVRTAFQPHGNKPDANYSGPPLFVGEPTSKWQSQVNQPSQHIVGRLGTLLVAASRGNLKTRVEACTGCSGFCLGLNPLKDKKGHP